MSETHRTAIEALRSPEEQQARIERAAAYREVVGRALARMAAVDIGPMTFRLGPEGFERVGLSFHAFREAGLMPWPDGTWSGGKAPRDREVRL